jgi:RNA polymerase sigma-70 factor (ECF subfamily)
MPTLTTVFEVSKASPEILFERVKAGEIAAFDELYAANIERVLAAVKRYIHEPDTAEFLANDVFATVWRVRNTPSAWNGESTFSTWLTRIAINAALMHIRKHKSERYYIAYSLDEPIPRGRFSRTYRINDEMRMDFPVRDLNLEGVFDRQDLMEAVKQLPEDYRTVFQLRLIDGWSIKETCQKLGLKHNAVKSRLFRCRQILQEILNAKKLRPVSTI